MISVKKLLQKGRFFLANKRRVRELADTKIQIGDTPIKIKEIEPPLSYTDMRINLQNLGWEHMNFDKLCGLPKETIQAIQIEIKKDNFSVSDKQFQTYGLETFNLSEGRKLELNPYYQRLNALITNNHELYDQLQQPKQPQSKYLAQIYVSDIRKDAALNAIITFFVNNLQFPKKLEALGEPSLIKKLLMIKRELMIQGIKFTSQQEVKEIKRQKKKVDKKKIQVQNNPKDEDKIINQILQDEQIDEEQILSQVEQEIRLTNRINKVMEEVKKYTNQVQIKQVIGFEYQFWVDVKHNRNKNGVEEDYVIQEREIPNPNQTLLLTSKFPTIKVKYIVHKKKRKQHAMHFCTKAELLLLINKKHLRRIKIEWNGPSNKSLAETQNDYKIIDYQYLMNGNSTIKKVFEF